MAVGRKSVGCFGKKEGRKEGRKRKKGRKEGTGMLLQGRKEGRLETEGKGPTPPLSKIACYNVVVVGW
jgi:hypothetical protein